VQNDKVEKNINKKYDIIYGINPVREAIFSTSKGAKKIGQIKVKEMFVVERKDDKNIFENKRIKEILDYVKHAKIPVRFLTDDEAIKIIGDVKHQRIFVYAKKIEYFSLEKSLQILEEKEKAIILILDEIKDVQNFGAIIRTAGAVGVDFIFVSGVNQAPITSAVHKASAGVSMKIPIVIVSNIRNVIKEVKKIGFWVYGLAMESDEGDTRTSLLYTSDLDKKMALIIGSEDRGIHYSVQKSCDFLLHIPMENDVESLNASVSTAVTLYEWWRQNKSYPQA
jgi:23S rRNA (guanosine2251-2'-O)-methyltransferase